MGEELCQLQLLSIPSTHTARCSCSSCHFEGLKGTVLSYPSTTLYPRTLGQPSPGSRELGMDISGHWSRDPEHQEPPR